MADIDAALAQMRMAVQEMEAAADRSAQNWTTPRAPRKWSPSQVVEHVARMLDESVHAVSGRPAKFPVLPWLLRPLLRALFFNRALRRNASFGKRRSAKAFDPIEGPATPAAARQRLDTALAGFERACRDRLQTANTLESTLFGRITVDDYVRAQAAHVGHHTKQILVQICDARQGFRSG